MRLFYSKELYSKTALIKAAYLFVDRAYIHLDSDDTNFIVELMLKTEDDSITQKEFDNEMLTQSIRYEITQSTKVIRELTIARSLASTVVNICQDEDDYLQKVFEENTVLKDWFDSND